MQHEKKHWKTRTYFLLCVLAVTTVTTGVYIFIRGRQVVAEHRQLVSERDKLFAHTLAQSISVYVKMNVEKVENLARLARQHEFTVEELYPLIENAAQSSSSFDSMSIVDKDGNIIVGNNKLASNENERRFGGITVSERKFYKDLIATQKTVVSDAIISRIPPYASTVVVAAPIFDTDKKLAGMALGALSLGPLNRLAEAALGDEWAIPVVIDKQGQVIVHRDSTFAKEGRLLKDFEPARRALRGEEGFLDAFIDTDGKERSAAYVQVPEFGWGVWVAQDTVQFSQARQRVLYASTIWGAATMLVLFLIFLILSRILFRPLDDLSAEAVSIVEKNDFHKRIEVNGMIHSYEIVSLADTFNLLIEKVKKSFDDQKESLKIKSQFLTVTTHAFRTPLNVLQWNLTSIREKISSYSDEQKTELIDLYESTQRLLLGFENLFTALEIQEKTARVDYKNVDLTPLIDSITQKLQPLAEKWKITTTFSTKDAVTLAGDERKIRRVMEVLYANAIFYNRQGGTIDIALSQDKDVALFKVTDSGIGISRDEREHLFEGFFRGKKAVLKYTDGTGLGLFIAKAFVDLHQGSIEVTSQEAEGSTFTVKLPLRVAFGVGSKK